MKYRLYNGEQRYDGIEQVLHNRGIDECQTWIDAGWEQIYDYSLFGPVEIAKAVNLLQGCIERDEDIFVVVDCDVDGFSSAATLINFLYALYPQYASRHIEWGLHENKTHGLTDMLDKIPDSASLVIVPDAGSSDYSCHNDLVERGKSVLILDHHEVPDGINQNKHVVTINNQTSDYPNKSLTGVGVVWKFCRAYEDLFVEADFYKVADSFMDMIAFGTISDMADFRDYEVRAIVNIGLEQERLKNPFLKELCSKNEYTMSKYGGFTYKGIAFGATPFVNAICRSGTLDEKDTVFRSMLDMYGQTFVPSGKRGEGGIDVPLYQEAVRIALNVKSRQTKEQNEATEIIESRIDDNDSVICALCSPDEARPELCGLIANKLQSEYGKPALVLIDYEDEGVYRGSARNTAISPVEDFRDLCVSSGLVDYAAGHGSAFGAQIKKDNIDALIDFFNESELKNNDGKEHIVDFIWKMNEIPVKFFNEVDLCSDFWGQQMPEPLVAVKSIPMKSTSIQLLSPDKSPTLKMTLQNGIQLLKFKSSKKEYDALLSADDFDFITIVGTCSINRWNGNEYPQILIDDYEVKEEWIF